MQCIFNSNRNGDLSLKEIGFISLHWKFFCESVLGHLRFFCEQVMFHLRFFCESAMGHLKFFCETAMGHLRFFCESVMSYLQIEIHCSYIESYFFTPLCTIFFIFRLLYIIADQNYRRMLYIVLQHYATKEAIILHNEA